MKKKKISTLSIICLVLGITMFFPVQTNAFGVLSNQDQYDYITNRESGPEIDYYTTEQLASDSGTVYMKRENAEFILYGEGTIQESTIVDYLKSIDYECTTISKFTITSDSKITVIRNENNLNMFRMVDTSGRYHRRYYWSYDSENHTVVHKNTKIENGATSKAKIILKNVEFSSAVGLFNGCEDLSDITFDNITFSNPDAELMFYGCRINELDLSNIHSPLKFNNSFDNEDATVILNHDADTSCLCWGDVKIIDARNVDNLYIPMTKENKSYSWSDGEDIHYGGENVPGGKIYTSLGYTGQEITLDYGFAYDKKIVGWDEDDEGRLTPKYKGITTFTLVIDGANLSKKYEIPDITGSGFVTYIGLSHSKSSNNYGVISSPTLDTIAKITQENGKSYLQLTSSVKQNETLYLVYAPNNYVLTVHDMITEQEIEIPVKSGQVYYIPASEHEGYKLCDLTDENGNSVYFDAIFENYFVSVKYDAISGFKNEDATVYLQYKPIEYRIQYQQKIDDHFEFYDWDQRPYTVDQDFNHLLQPEVNNTLRKGYRLNGWYADEAMTKKVEKIEKGQPGDKVLYGEFFPVTVNTTFDLNGGTAGGDYPSTMTYDTGVNFAEPTKEGYTFDGWYTDPAFTGKSKVRDTWTFDEDCTVYAKWITNASCTHENTEVHDRKEATCKEDGYSGDLYCTDCDKLITEGHTVEKTTTHGTVEVRNQQDATCKAEGYSGDKYCSVCGELIEEGHMVEKTSHDWGEPEIITPATSTTKGEAKYTCSICGMTKTVIIPATGCTHETTILKNYKISTCAEEGYSGDTYCADCGELVSEGETTEKSHTHGKSELRNIKEVTATENGYSGDLYCTICGELLMEGYTIRTIKPVLNTQSITLQAFDETEVEEDDEIPVYKETKSGEYKEIKETPVSTIRKLTQKDSKLSIRFNKEKQDTVRIKVSKKKDMSKSKTYRTRKQRYTVNGLKTGTYYISIKLNDNEWSTAKKIKVK